MIYLVRIGVNELSEGMIIVESINDSRTGKLLLKSDTKLTEGLIASLKSHFIQEVTIEERYTLSISPTDMTRKEIRQILHNEIARLASEKAEANLNDRITNVAKIITDIVNEIVEDDKIINLCVQMKIQDNDFIYNHCVYTCALSLLVAGAMNLEANEIKTIGQAALLHDLGLCEMAYIVRKIEKSPQEEELWKEHASYGYHFAKQSGIDEEVAKLILSHHESWDGSGFPNKVSSEDIPLGARIIAVCDKFDRLLRYEKYPHYLALEYLYGGLDCYFDGNVITTFLDNLPIYPLGSIVRLSTNEVGVVVNIRKNAGMRPIVRVYFNNVKRMYKIPKDKDLGEENTVFIKEIL